ncbi:hypothetical protein [Actinacidiphila soli]|jgi:hypothetical protein|uniref:hypothetical protein n=1 Tax=Actinacidiphila soli TaxID=2487275 RepID=UPI000FCB3B2F|nr:hypothetical protein [Actinacidiphila soli]
MITGKNQAAPRRRAVLAASALPAVGALLGGCSNDDSAQRTAASLKASPSASPGAVLQAAAGRDSTGLLAKYDAVIAAYPALAGRLAPLRAEVARHAKAFGATASASASPSTSASPVAPGTGDAALAALASAEQSLADARTKALLDAPSELARLLASVAAAGSCHVLLLKEG